MAQGKRFHLSYERMALLVDGAPAYKDDAFVLPKILDRIQSISYSFDYNAQQLREIGSHEYIKDKGVEYALKTDPSLIITAAAWGVLPDTAPGDGTGKQDYNLQGEPRSKSRIPIVAQPKVGLQFSYFLFDGSNEEKMGFTLDQDSIFKIPQSKLYGVPDWEGDGVGAVATIGDVNFFVLAEDVDRRKDIVGRPIAVQSSSAPSGDYLYNPVLRVWELGGHRIISTYKLDPNDVNEKEKWGITNPVSGAVLDYFETPVSEGQPLAGAMKNGSIITSPFLETDVIGFGNCYLNSYTLSAAMGSFLTCSANYDCSNLSFDIYDPDTFPKSPAVNKDGDRSGSDLVLPDAEIAHAFELTEQEEESFVLVPGDIEVTVTNNKPDGGFHLIDLNTENMAIQSVEISVPIERKDINGLGSNYIKDRKMQFPILGTISMSVIARHFEDLEDIENIFNDDVDCDIELVMRNRTGLVRPIGTATRADKIKVAITNAKLNSESHSFQIGGFANVSANFVFEVTPSFGFSMHKL